MGYPQPVPTRLFSGCHYCQWAGLASLCRLSLQVPGLCWHPGLLYVRRTRGCRSVLRESRRHLPQRDCWLRCIRRLRLSRQIQNLCGLVPCTRVAAVFCCPARRSLRRSLQKDVGTSPCASCLFGSPLCKQRHLRYVLQRVSGLCSRPG